MGIVRLAAAFVMLAAAPVAGQTLWPQIVNGTTTRAWPEVGALESTLGSCSATLVGCRTALTAAHCVCSPSGTGAPCGGGEFVLDPADMFLYLPQAGFLFVQEVGVAPGYEFAVGGDLALLKLLGPVRGVRPRALNTLGRPPFGTPATIVGFGNDLQDAGTLGMKRVGAVSTQSCVGADVPDATHVCWLFDAVVGPPGTDSSICGGDSGGPLIADLGVGPTLLGVHSGLSTSVCQETPSTAFDTDLFVQRSWIHEQSGVDLDAGACGDGPQVGDPEVVTHGWDGVVVDQALHSFSVGAETKLLRVGLNGQRGSPPNDLDLYLRFGTSPTTLSFDCSSASGGSFESCAIADPAPGTWYALVDVFQGFSQAYQLTVTLLPENPPAPAPAPGQILVSNFASFELLQAEPVAGDRAITSSSLRGFGPELAGPEGIALEPGGALLVANAFQQNLLRIDLATGDRTVVSGCADAACSSLVGGGPAFLSPRFLALEGPDRAVVTDRLIPASGGFISAVVRVDLRTGDRSVLSGCAAVVGDACAQVVGAGPAFDRIFGIALDAEHHLIVADSQAVLRVHPESGDRQIVSGCHDPSCSGLTGSGPVFGGPTDVVVDAEGIFVSYQTEGLASGTLRRVNPVTGARVLVSGCVDPACTMLLGSGPGFREPFGISFDAAGDFLVADLALDAVLHVERATGARTIVSGCQDDRCTSATGDGAHFAQALDVVVVPETRRNLARPLALAMVVALRALRPKR